MCSELTAGFGAAASGSGTVARILCRPVSLPEPRVHEHVAKRDPPEMVIKPQFVQAFEGSCPVPVRGTACGAFKMTRILSSVDDVRLGIAHRLQW